MADMRPVDVVDLDAARQLHGHGELVLQQGQGVGHPLLAAVGQTPEDGATNEHGLSAQGQCLEHVGPAKDAPIHVDLAGSVHGAHHLRQHLNRGCHRVQLPGSVIGDPDAVHLVLHCHLGVLGSLHPLHHNLEGGDGAQPLDVLPVEGAVNQAGHVGGKARVLATVLGALSMAAPLAHKVAHGQVGRQLEAVPDVSLAAAQHRGVHSHGQGLVARRLRPAHQVQGHHPVLVDVELKPAQPPGRSVRHLLQSRGGPAGQGHQGARLGACLGSGALSVIMGHPLHG
mmetsp:Transcript_8571/g.13147  ORF Transcript_8571/g.13147 Transcript_8571/m.13147 type:complete len:284 (-) Transcript_8571:313-1164(-)